MNPLHKYKIMSVGYQVKQNLKSGDMENLNSLLKFWVWESGRKIDPATGINPEEMGIEEWVILFSEIFEGMGMGMGMGMGNSKKLCA